MSSDNLAAAIEALQNAQNELVEAIKTLEEHKTDTEAHPDIREILQEMNDGEAMYTRAQIREFINEVLNVHKVTDWKDAHANANSFVNDLEEKLASITTSIDEINDKLDKKDSDQSSLQSILQEIEDKYEPILKELTEALAAAQNAGSTELADQYRETIKATLDQKSTELLKAMQKWQEEHS